MSMATFARELQYQHSQQGEIVQEGLRKALAKTESARVEANMELKRVQDSIEQKSLKREKKYEARLAQVEANAWAEIVSNRDFVKSISAISITNAAEHKLAFDKDIVKGEETTKGLCKGIETSGCHSVRLDSPAVASAAKECFRIFPWY